MANRSVVGRLMDVRAIRAILEPLLFRRVLNAAGNFEEGDPCYASNHMLMIRRFCSTNGASQDALLEVFQKKRPRSGSAAQSYKGVCGEFDGAGIGEIVSSLKRDGYYRFPNLLPEGMCDELIKLAKTTECGRNRPAPSGEPETMVVDIENPITDTYHLPKSAVLSCRAGQRLVADAVFLAISEEYFGCRPVFSNVSQWWSFPHPKGDPSSSAQMYHFDMERVKWLKFFVYLTDVTRDTGAHYFVKGTHRSGSQPEELRRKDYRRITDEEISRNFGGDEILKMSGVKGAVFVEDTRGYHKGNPLKTGHRLVIDVEYASSLFGTPYDRIKVRDPERILRSPLVEERFGDLYARCDFEGGD